MKKTVALTVVLMLAFAGMALAENGSTTAGGQTIFGSPNNDAATSSDTAIGKLSNNVTASWATDSVTPAGQGYAIATFHTSGSQAYGTAHDSTSLFQKKVTALPTLSNTGTNDFDSGNWTAL